VRVFVLGWIVLVDFSCGMPRIGSVIVQMNVHRGPAVAVCVHVPCEYGGAARGGNVERVVSFMDVLGVLGVLGVLAVRLRAFRERRLVGMHVIAVCGVNGDGKRVRFGNLFKRLPIAPAIGAIEAPALSAVAQRLEPNAIA